MQCSLREMRYKEVISVDRRQPLRLCGGRGHRSGQRPGARRSSFRASPASSACLGRREDTAVPWDQVRRFGEDIIRVEGTGQCAGLPEKPRKGDFKRRGLF